MPWFPPLPLRNLQRHWSRPCMAHEQWDEKWWSARGSRPILTEQENLSAKNFCTMCIICMTILIRMICIWFVNLLSAWTWLKTKYFEAQEKEGSVLTSKGGESCKLTESTAHGRQFVEASLKDQPTRGIQAFTHLAHSEKQGCWQNTCLVWLQYSFMISKHTGLTQVCQTNWRCTVRNQSLCFWHRSPTPPKVSASSYVSHLLFSCAI